MHLQDVGNSQNSKRFARFSRPGLGRNLQPELLSYAITVELILGYIHQAIMLSHTIYVAIVLFFFSFNMTKSYLQIIQKLSTRMPTLENKIKMLKEIASDNNIDLQIEENVSEVR